MLAAWLAEEGAIEQLANFGRESLQRIPPECFAVGQHDKVLDLVAERERRAAAAQREQDGLAAIEDAIARMRAAENQQDNAAWRTAAETYLASLNALGWTPPPAFKKAWAARIGKLPASMGAKAA